MGKECSRRDFLKLGIGTAAVVGLAGPLAGSVGPLLAGEPREAARAIDLAVATGTPRAGVRGALELLGGIGRFVKAGDFVLLKPNMSFATPPEMGATTHPEVVAAVAAMCVDAGARRVLVADHTIRASKVCLEYTGIQAACAGLDRTNVVALNDETQYTRIPIPEGKVLRTTQIARDVLRADVLINLPVAKSHSGAGVAFGIKNLMGLVWDRKVFHTGDLHQSIADLGTVIRADLTIMDATRALVQGGPSGPGRTEVLDRIVAGTDPLAVDSYTLSLTKWYNRRFTARQVRHFVAASEMGLGEIDTGKLRIATTGEVSDGDEDQKNQ
ncbi:MAG: DUF362 domain-containing protein [Candidatus Eisenbacteria sp.]|nr:DUF362 domain-containing protein [Candidatus Eisenbacteria bacterium]